MSGVRRPPLIAHIVYRFGVGGLENGVVNLINGLPPRAWRHAVISLTEIDPSFAARISRRDVQFVELRKAAGHAYSLYPKLFGLFRAMRPDIVHTRNLAALEATVPAWAAGVPVRIHGEHGRDIDDLHGTNARRRMIRRLFSPFVTRYVAVSPDLALYLSRAVGIAPRRIEQIFNGVDTRRFTPRTSVRSLIPGCPFVSPTDWIVGSVGRMDPVKDQATLARAFVRLRAGHRESDRMRLVFAGDGQMRHAIESMLADAGNRDRAWFAGERNDIADIMRGLDCFVLPSLAEGMSNTILEAMAAALPVIATRVGANPELIVDGVTGCLIPPADAEALADAMDKYLCNPELGVLHGRNGRDVAERTFGLDAMIRRYDELYRSLRRARAQRRGLSSAADSPHLGA